MFGTLSRLDSILLCATVVALPTQSLGQSLRPRPALVKPLHTTVDSRDESQVIYVKFHDGLMVRLRDGALTDLGTMALDQSAQATLDGVAAGAWQRVHRVTEAKLDAWRIQGQNNSGRALADLNLEYYLWLPPGADTAKTIDAFNALEVVEMALPVGRPLPEPSPPSFVSQQVYLNAAPDGVSAKATWWTKCGSIGGGIEIADVENGWDFSHLDLPNDVNIVHPNSTCPPNSTKCPGHGKAVMGVLASIRNAFGTTGVAYGSTFHVVGAYEGFTNIPGAITDAMDEMLLDGVTGDVILIEMQEDGPNFDSQACDDLIEATDPFCFGGDDPCSTAVQCGLIPVEWKLSAYNAITTAVDNGLIVVEAAGNGWQDLDDADIYGTGNGGHFPFRPENDSGAIIVGAGATPLSDDCVERSRRQYSCYGSRVDVQGWGHRVVTTGGDSLYFEEEEGPTLGYSDNFSGTSSASALVAGACALIQGTYKSRTGNVLTPAALRDLLVATGSPQQAGVDCWHGPGYGLDQQIGPQPDVAAAIASLFPFADCNCSGTDDECDINCAAQGGACNNVPGCGTSQDCSLDGVPNECEADCNDDGTPDECQGGAPPLPPGTILFVKPPPVRKGGPAQRGGDGLSWGTAFTDPQVAFDLAHCNDVDEIWIGSGDYPPDGGSGSRTATFFLPVNVGVYGGFAGNEINRADRDPVANPTILSGDIGTSGFDGDNSYHVVTIDGGDERTILDGFVISDGQANAIGVDDNGGGLLIVSGSPSIKNCVFRDNAASQNGGAVYVQSGTANLTHCRFLDNTASNDGGGLANSGDAYCQVVNCLFGRNGAANGGGLANLGGGAGIGGVRLMDCTLRDNTASRSGGGLFTAGLGFDLSVLNTILWNNSDGGGTDESAQVHADAGSPLIAHSCIQGLSVSTNGNIGDDPMFDTGAGPDEMPLGVGSPCIDAGQNTAVPADACDVDGNGDSAETLPLDLAGDPRIVGCVDMGAYEFQTALQLPGDLDADGDRDTTDHAAFVVCLTGPCIVAPGDTLYLEPCCVQGDFEPDGCITLRDFAGMQNAIGGP